MNSRRAIECEQIVELPDVVWAHSSDALRQEKHPQSSNVQRKTTPR